jgi:hypothetical protein
MTASASGTPSPELAFRPILNGVDFLDRAIDELLEAHEPRELKYAVLHLQAAAEILIKARLQREGIQHVFEDPEESDAAKWERGDFKSVTLTTALTVAHAHGTTVGLTCGQGVDRALPLTERGASRFAIASWRCRRWGERSLRRAGRIICPSLWLVIRTVSGSSARKWFSASALA